MLFEFYGSEFKPNQFYKEVSKTGPQCHPLKSAHCKNSLRVLGEINVIVSLGLKP